VRWNLEDFYVLPGVELGGTTVSRNAASFLMTRRTSRYFDGFSF
jgi:hypothetical protein